MNQIKRDEDPVLITSAAKAQVESINPVDRLPEFDEYGTALNVL